MTSARRDTLRLARANGHRMVSTRARSHAGLGVSVCADCGACLFAGDPCWGSALKKRCGKAKRTTKRNPGAAKRKHPAFVRQCVRSFARKHGSDRDTVSRAFAICTAQGRKLGYVTPRGAQKGTPRGRGWAKSRGELGRMKDADYERVLSEARGELPLR